MKKILVLSGSPRKHGNSDLLCDEFIKGAESKGHKTKKIFIQDEKLNYCLGCENCANTGKCIHKDNMENIINDMIEADVILLASPVYFYSVSGQMKVLIDRTVPAYTKINNKEFYFIATAADTNSHMLDRTIECFRGFIDCLDGAEEKGYIKATNVWKKGEVNKTLYLKEAYELGYNI